MFASIYNTFLRPTSDVPKWPHGLTDSLRLIEESKPTVGQYNNITSLSDILRCRKLATGKDATYQQANEYLRILQKDITTKLSSGQYSILDIYGMNVSAPASICEFVAKNNKSFKTIGLCQELPVAVWILACLVYENSFKANGIDEEEISKACDLFEWHSKIGEKPGFCHGTITTIPSFINSHSGRFMFMISQALLAYTRFQKTHETYCSDKNLPALTYWFLHYSKQAFKFAYDQDCQIICAKLADYATVLNDFFFLADHCFQSKEYMQDNINFLKQCIHVAEKNKLVDLERMKITLDNLFERGNISGSSWFSINFITSVVYTQPFVPRQNCTKQEHDNYAPLTRYSSSFL